MNSVIQTNVRQFTLAQDHNTAYLKNIWITLLIMCSCVSHAHSHIFLKETQKCSRHHNQWWCRLQPSAKLSENPSLTTWLNVTWELSIADLNYAAVYIKVHWGLGYYLVFIYFVPWWQVWAEIECMAHVALPKQPVN